MDYNIELMYPERFPLNGKVLFLVTGLPGSGKSTYAKELAERISSFSIYDPHIYEADMFFMERGVYKFDRTKLGRAHFWCQYQVKKEMEAGFPVIVANTSLTPKERKRYLELAVQYGYKVFVHECSGNFKNIHGVDDETLAKMKNRYKEFNVSELKNGL